MNKLMGGLMICFGIFLITYGMIHNQLPPKLLGILFVVVGRVY